MGKNMRAIVKIKSAQGSIEMQNVSKPCIQNPDDVMIQVFKTAICGTDIHIYDWDEWAAKTIPAPMIIGHEFYGKVIEVGPNVKHLEVGDRVSGEGHITCEKCRNCLAGRRYLCPNTKGVGVNIAGAFAEYIVIPKQNVFKIPKIISDDIASIMDPYGNAVHTALAFPCHGEDVLITGAGPIGIMAALICQHLGARNVVLTDINEHRLAIAKQLGVKNVINTKDNDIKLIMQKLNIKEGFDICLEMSGQENALNNAISLMINGGNIAILGIFKQNINLCVNDIVFKGLNVKGIYGRQIFDTWYKMVTLIESGLKIDNIITHQYKAEDFLTAFEIIKTGTTGKVILNWI